MEATGQPIGRGTWLALIAMGVAVFVLATTSRRSTSPFPIEEDYETDVSTAQWVVNAYALTFGVLIVTEPGSPTLFGAAAHLLRLGDLRLDLVRRRGRAERGVADHRGVLMGIGGAMMMWPAILDDLLGLPEARAGSPEG